MDETSTDLALQLEDYDPSPSAEYESWLLLEEVRLALERVESRVALSR